MTGTANATQQDYQHEETYGYDGAMLRRWLSAEVRAAAAVTGIALAAGCSAQAAPAQASGHVSSADTGWFAAARLTGHSGGSLSWQDNPYLSLDLVAGGASGATILAGGAGMIP